MQKFPPHRTSSIVIFIGSAGNSVIFQSTKTRSQHSTTLSCHMRSGSQVLGFFLWGADLHSICFCVRMCVCLVEEKQGESFPPWEPGPGSILLGKLQADNRAKLHDYFGTKFCRWSCCVVRGWKFARTASGWLFCENFFLRIKRMRVNHVLMVDKFSSSKHNAIGRIFLHRKKCW